MEVDFSTISKDAKRKAIDAITTMWGKGSPKFQEYIKNLLEIEPLFAEPIFQAVFPYKQSAESFGDCNLFDEKFKKAIAEAEGNYKFPLNRNPYEHQSKAWKEALENKKSIAVTTGTGSGKTECFMLPVLYDIYEKYEENAVQAIFLYPLNALMGSQKKRIKSWTNSVNKYCNSNISFAQYNGKLKERGKKAEKFDCEIPCRELMRETPPQILFTNPTMLEYMLVRKKDASILEKSKGKLRWIILDEAHTFSGSNATEMAFLIKRILHAFEVNKNQVRFAATSATVAGEGTYEQLVKFISDLTGKEQNEIKIISGEKECNNDELSKILLRDEFKSLKELGTFEKVPVHIRGHFFERALPGLFACTNANCQGYEFQGDFAYTLSSKKTLSCPVCKEQMLGLVACNNCNQLFFQGKKDKNDFVKVVELENDDILDLESDDEDTSEGDIISEDSDEILFAKRSRVKTSNEDIFFDIQNNEQKSKLEYTPDGAFVKIEACCPDCGESLNCRNLKHFGLPSEFLSRLAIPILLDEMPEIKPSKGDEIYKGKKLMAFTDSRQGTARSAALLNNEVERNFIRTAVYHTLCIQKRLNWSDLINAICQHYSSVLKNLINHIKRNYNISEVDYVESLLVDQFLFIPKKSNSLETLGLVNVVYNDLNKCQKPDTGLFKEDSEWHSFLKIFLDYYIRSKQAVNIRANLDPSLFLMHYHKCHLKEKDLPQLNLSRNPSRIIAILCAGLGITIEHNQDRINDTIKKAFKQLRIKGFLQGDEDNGYAIDINSFSFELTTQASICPVTNNFVSINFKGYSPWIKGHNFERFKIEKKKLNLPIPNFPYTKKLYNGEPVEDKVILEWIDGENGWKNLKNTGSWSDLIENIFLYKDIFLAAEHSAQQSDIKLRDFEERFEQNKLNILGCSTTMEMGVDIGGISGILMNTVPPKPANYMQRAGRAGRRNEPRSIAYTMCSATPIGEQVMDNPKEAIFRKAISPPRINFNSDKILQRHINSFLFGIYVRKIMSKKNVGINIKEQTEDFFGSLNDNQSYAEHFNDWLQEPNVEYLQELEKLFNKKPANTYVNKTRTNIQKIIMDYNNKLNRLETELKEKGELDRNNEPQTLAGKAIQRELDRLQDDNLLKFLVEKEFLPGAGIPTGVVEFNNENFKDIENRYKKNNENKDISNFYIKGDLPSRDFAVALREYAPGSTVVIDGWAYKSAGILMDSQFDSTNKQNIRQCLSCGNQYFVDSTNYTEPCKCGEKNTIGLINSEAMESLMLEPVGYAVDIYDKPRRNIKKDAYVPIREPLLINMERWDNNQKSFYDVRRSDENSVAEILYYDKGSGLGYAVCLKCGKAYKETEPQSKTMDEFLKNHHRLRGGKEKNDSSIKFCDGNIERKVVLAGKMQTDICEIRLSNFIGKEYSKDGVLLRTFATALKNVFVEWLGIESNEINFNIKKNKINNKIFISAFFFDSLKGGAGYCTQLASQELMDSLINELIERFVKKECFCKKACQKCLINKESQWHLESLDRNVLIAWLKLYEKHTEELPSKLKSVDEKLQRVKTNLLLSLKNLCDREKVKEIIFFIDGNDLDLNVAEITKFLNEQRSKGIQIGLKIYNYQRKNDLMEETVQQMRLKLLADVKIIDRIPSIENNFVPVVSVESDKNKTIYGMEYSNDVILPNLNIKWAENKEFYISQSVKIPDIKEVELKSPKLEPSREAMIEIPISGKINIYKFGEKLFNLYKEKLPEIENLISGKIISLTYSDRYLHSPFGAMLLFEFIGYIKKIAREISKITIKTENISGSSDGSTMYKNWINDNKKISFLEGLIENNCQVNIGNQEHDRYLTINTDSNTIKIYFLAGIENGWRGMPLKTYWSFRHNEEMKKLILSYHNNRKNFLMERIETVNHAIKISS